MREILFRAKRLDNGEWVEGHLLHDSEQNESYIAEYFEDKSAYLREVDPETVCQFTGLTDKNGNKIWENDTLKMFYENGETDIGTIRYTKECARFQYYEDNLIGYGIDITCDMEVIGNIFDNPELMKGGEQ